jgi:hypothetical protein
MGIELKKGENVFYPAPYVPSEPAMLIVTDQRLVYFGNEGRQEMDAKKVSFVGRTSGRPFLVMCIVFALIGLPILAYAANRWYGAVGEDVAVKDLKSFAEQPPITEDPGIEDPAWTKVKVIAMGAVGAGLLAAAWFLVKKKRYLVTVRGGQQLMRIIMPDEMKQTQVMMTIQAMQQTVKAMAKPAAAPAAAPKT